MRSSIALTLALLAPLASTTGCTVIADPDGYSLDLGCDLDLTLVGFDGPHLGQTVVVQVDKPREGATSAPFYTLAGIARIDNYGAGDAHFHIPLGIPTVGARLDFYVDNNDPTPAAVYNPVSSSGSGRGDHSWTIENACAVGPSTFTHVANFDDFEGNSIGLDDALVFELDGFDITNATVEVRVLVYDENLDAVDGAGDGRYTRALIHARGQSDGGGVLTLNPLRGSLDRGGAFDVELWIDRDGDQVVDLTSDPATNEGFQVSFVPEATPGALLIPQAGNLQISATDGSGDHSGTVGVTFE